MITRHMAQDRGGFTLIELLIYTALLALIGTGFISFALSLSDVQTKHRSEVAVHENTVFALDQIRDIVQRAEVVRLASSTLGQHPSRLVLGMPRPVEDPTIIDLTEEGRLRVRSGQSPAEVITSDVVSIPTFIVTAFNTSTGRASLQFEMRLETRGDSVFYRSVSSVTTTVDIRD